MITFPNAKINLGLNIIGKRPDGYHNLETIFYPIPLEDALEITVRNNSEQKFVLQQAGMEIAGDPETNLVVRAYKLLDEKFDLPPIDIHLYKQIPSGAGLGGGSADAAFMLKLLNEKFSLNLNRALLEAYAATLGADCAFFVENSPIFAEGIGNLFSPIPLSLKDYQLVLIKPDIFVSTREAFAQIHPHQPEYSLKDIIARPVEEWKNNLVNDFEKSVFPQHPAIGKIKENLYREGALYAAMSGSGSSVFGIFHPVAKLPELNYPKAFHFHCILK